MDRNKIKLKYLLNIWKTLPNYPTIEDAIYEINLFLLKEGKPNGDFSVSNYKTIFRSNWEKSHIKIIEEMIENSIIEESSKSKDSKKIYKISNNPYYK
jgi:hypothetical protein